MKYILFILLISCWSIKAQNCKGFMQGTFKMKYQYGEVLIERMGNWQLEKSEEYGAVYLNKIEKIDSCEYSLSYYKIIKSGTIPEPDMKNKAITEITNIEDNNYYFKSSMVGTEISIEGIFIKKSDEISDEFKKLIAEEKKSLD